MTKETELKKLAEQMAKHVGSFEDIKAFQKELMQSSDNLSYLVN